MNILLRTKKLPKESLYKKLLRSHLAVAGLGFIVLTAALVAIWILGSNASRLATDIGPTAQTSLRVYSGIQSSLAAMRGWVALGDPQFRIERKQAWEQSITPAMTKLKSKLEGTADADSIKHISLMLNELEEVQWWIEDVAQTPGNNQPQYYFNSHIYPIGNTIEKAITGIISLTFNSIDVNRTLPLIKSMISFRYHFGQSVNALERYSNNSESSYIGLFRENIKQTLISFNLISKSRNELSAEQQQLFQLISAELSLFEQFGDNLIKIRTNSQWNVAQYHLSTQAIPLARQLLNRLGSISTRYDKAMQEQANYIEQVLVILIIFSVVLIIMMAVMAVSFSKYSAKRLTKPISALSKAVKELASGALKDDLEVEGSDELATLTDTFNVMRRSVQEHTDALENARVNLELRVAKRTEELAVSRDLAEITLHSIGDAVITTNNHQLISMMNPAAESLTGWSFKEVEGQAISTVFKVVNENTQSKVACPVSHCLLTHKVTLLDNESNLICRDGSQISISDSAAPIHGQDGKVVGAILVFRDVTHERGLQKKLSYQATHDPLTGLANRYEFNLRLQTALMFANNEQREHAVAFLDLDQFKIINDTCGHAAGDELLRQLSKKLAEPIRTHDTLARLGGDEFAILLEDCAIERAKKICEKIRQDIKEFRFGWDDRSFEVGVSIGLVSVDQYSHSASDILSSADVACYAAKEAGRNCVHLYSCSDDGTNNQRSEMGWVSRITEALDEDRLVLYVQPIVPLASQTEKKSHCEVLVRLLDRDGSLIPPGSFLPAAERYNLIQSIDCKVVSLVCKAYQNKIFGDFSNQNQVISVNLSGHSLGDKKVLQCIKTSLHEYAVPPEVICFEITETAAMRNMSQTLDFINTLKSMGCSFALDDFGSGLSSFGYLQNIPVDYIKIDGCFVKDIVDNSIDAAMVSSINEIAHLMGKKTIAEYVENTEISDKLREIGVDYVQGWGIGKPVPAEKYRAISYVK